MRASKSRETEKDRGTEGRERGMGRISRGFKKCIEMK